MSLQSTPNSRRRYGTEASSPMPYGTPRSLISGDRTPGTPYRQRPDLGSSNRSRVLTLHDGNQDENQNVMSPSATSDISILDNAAGKMVIWGTDISINEAQMKFKNFLMTFTLQRKFDDLDDTLNEDDIQTPYYLQKIEEVSPILKFLF
ncbi:unnamed protein product [Gordionus sp. m RMFG-2023]